MTRSWIRFRSACLTACSHPTVGDLWGPKLEQRHLCHQGFSEQRGCCSVEIDLVHMGHPAYNEVDHITINRLLCLLLLHDASVNVLIVSCRKGWGGGKEGYWVMDMDIQLPCISGRERICHLIKACVKDYKV